MGNWSQLAKQQTAQPVQEQEQIVSWSNVAKQQQQVAPKEPTGAGGSFETRSWIDTLRSGALNAPRNAYKYGKDIFTALSHPIETAKGVNQLLEHATVEPWEMERYGHSLDIIADHAKERYGTIEKLKEQIAFRPVETLADFASILMPVGKATQMKKITKLGSSLEPMNIARRAAKVPFRLIPEKTPIKLYQSAVKFGTTLTGKQRNAVTKTALKFNIMPHNKGMEKLGELIWKYNDEITTKVEKATERGYFLKIEDAYKGLDKIKKKFMDTSSEPSTWEKAFDSLEEQKKIHLKSNILRSPEQIQKMKQSIYQELQTFYEKHKASPAKVKYKKQIAKNCKEMLETIIPEIKQLNKNEGALIDLFKAVESKANRITNRDLIGIGLPVKMGTGAGVGFMFAGEAGGQLGTKLGFLLGVLDVPQIKSRVAMVLNELRKKGIKIKPTQAAIKLGLYQTGREQTE